MENNVIIFGDSYSTFEGYIPEGYEAYYSEKEHPHTDVRHVSQTWWHQVCSEINFNLILNNSWSGSTIGYTGYNNRDCSKSTSFIYRFRQLVDSGFFEQNRVDTVFIFGGTNDSWSNAPLGEMKFSDWDEGDLFYALPAISYFLQLVKSTLKDAKIYCLINIDLSPEITGCLKASCEKYNITEITFDAIDKNCRLGHPSIKGMENIKDGVLKVLKKAR